MQEMSTRIRESIRAAGMTVGQVCSILGVSKSTFYRKMSNPGLLTMAEIDALGRMFRWKILVF